MVGFVIGQSSIINNQQFILIILGDDFILGLIINTLTMFGYILWTALFTYLCQAVNRYAPVWVTSPYIKSQCYNVIAVVTGNSSTPTATIPFPGSAFTQIPNIGYGAFIY